MFLLLRIESLVERICLILKLFHLDESFVKPVSGLLMFLLLRIESRAERNLFIPELFDLGKSVSQMFLGLLMRILFVFQGFAELCFPCLELFHLSAFLRKFGCDFFKLAVQPELIDNGLIVGLIPELFIKMGIHIGGGLQDR